MAEPVEPVTTVTPVTIRGRYLWVGDKRFMINGVVYRQLTPRDGRTSWDPLSDDELEELERSIPLLKELRINTIYVPFVDPNKNHDAAMNMLAEAGIYVVPYIAPVFKQIDVHHPLDSYTVKHLQYYFRVAEAMTRYPNTLGLVVSQKLIRDNITTPAAAFIRALVRDVKRYLTILAKKKNRRVLPVGIIVSDVRPILRHQFDYFSAGKDEEAIDFFAFNSFAWSGKSSMHVSGYFELVETFSTTHIPVFFSAYGNNFHRPRTFHETRAMYSDPDMIRVFSGGIVYEFFEEAVSQYGLVHRLQADNTGEVLLSKRSDYKGLLKSLRLSYMLNPSPVVPAGSAKEMEKPKQPEPDYIWMCVQPVPKSPLDWAEVEAQTDDSDWVDVGKEMLDNALDELTSSIWENLTVEDIGP